MRSYHAHTPLIPRSYQKGAGKAGVQVFRGPMGEQMLTKSFEMLTKSVEILTKSVEMLTKPIEILTKSIEMLTKIY